MSRVRLPATFVPTHQTAGLPGFPAVDVFAPAGSPVEAGFWGRVSKVSGHEPTGHETPGGAYGLSVYVHNAVNGLTRYVTHMGTRRVSVGSIVRPGTVLGTVAHAPAGSPHGSEHVHLGLHRPDRRGT